jgi:hypothetical protein
LDVFEKGSGMKAMLLACFRGPPADKPLTAKDLFAQIESHRFEASASQKNEAIDRARHKHRQDVMPLDPRSSGNHTPEALVEVGVSKIQALAQQVRSALGPEAELEAGRHNDRRLHVGQVIHDAVMHYFHAGLKGDNKVRISDDGTTPLMDVRKIVREATTSSLLRDLRNDIRKADLAKAAYGRGNCHEQAVHCGLMAKALGLPNQIIGIGDESGPRSVFDHVVMVLTPQPLEASDLQGGRYRSVADFENDWVVVDPWSKIVCTGDQYLKQVEDKFRKWSDEGKVLLNHRHGIALSPESEFVLRSLGNGAVRFGDLDDHYGRHPGLTSESLAAPGSDAASGAAGPDAATVHLGAADLARQVRIRAQLQPGARSGAEDAERPR